MASKSEKHMVVSNKFCKLHMAKLCTPIPKIGAIDAYGLHGGVDLSKARGFESSTLGPLLLSLWGAERWVGGC